MSFHNSFTDVHCHIFPGLDDGARSLEQSREMFEIAYEEGIRTIIVTPHNYASRNSAAPEKIMGTIQQLESRLKEWGIPIGGYTKMVENMLEGIEVRLGVDYFEHKDELDAVIASALALCEEEVV